uniref:acyltransferase family protein n=1 Tax=Parerythrobacter lutipelagi TaxID=1964208 RepID=UPI0010F50D71|nr:acyltransferase family protein [Parerythrobacter lutipelagi]
MDATAPRKHYHDIDGARSVLMFLSVALHAGTVYAPARPHITANIDRAEFFDWLIFGLHLLVTPTFFFVGGFFTVLLLSRRSVGDFFWNRFLRTAVPLITIAVTFNMLEHYLRYADAGGGLSFFGWIGSVEFNHVWSSGLWQLHLWFLVSLIPMFALSGIIHAVLPAQSRIRDLAKKASIKLGAWADSEKGGRFAILVLLLAFVNFANYTAAAKIPGSYELLLPGFQSWYKLTSEFPFYIVGVMAALSPRLLSGLTRWRGWMPYAAAAAFIIQPYAFPDNGMWEGIGRLFANQLAIWVLVLFILQFFHRYANFQSQRTAWLADCALSMYLFHHCLVYIFGRAFVSLDWPIAIEFLAITALAAGTVVVLHEYVIRRAPLARLLFNGKTDIGAIRKQRGALGSRPAPENAPAT